MKKFNEIADYVYANSPWIIDLHTRILMMIVNVFILILIIKNLFF